MDEGSGYSGPDHARSRMRPLGVSRSGRSRRGGRRGRRLVVAGPLGRRQLVERGEREGGVLGERLAVVGDGLLIPASPVGRLAAEVRR